MADRLGAANEELKSLVVKRAEAHGDAMARLGQAQQVAVAARAELDHVTHLSARGEMAAAIAHEINQPLTGIVAQANAAARWLAGSPPDLVKVRNALERIIGAGHHASEVIGGIRAMFKRDDNKRALFDVNEIIEETITLAQAELEDQCVAVQVDLANDLPHVHGDRVQMQQVIVNLIINAIDAMCEVRANDHFYNAGWW
jgi:C4-dicarboxylate-specific signal transduction histidine kinase